MLGRVLEVGLATPDIGRSCRFYAQLGFGSADTGDIWPHHYGVMTCRGLNLGLHGLRRPSPWLAFVRADVASLADRLEAAGHRISQARLGDNVFHELEFREPAGLMLRVLEARSFPPPHAVPPLTLLGRFDALSLPLQDFDAAIAFWESLGLSALPAQSPWKQLRIELPGFTLAYHRPALHDEPLLLFRQPDLDDAAEALESLGIRPERGLGGFGTPEHRIVASPEHLALVLLA